MTGIEKELFKMQDLNYKSFHSKLIPNVDPDTIIGIRVPRLRRYACEFSKTDYVSDFIDTLPHKYYEEYNLHTFLIEKIKDYDKAVEETEKILPYIDNWATCDMFMPSAFKQNKDKITGKISQWIKSDQIYTVRFAIGLLMSLYLDDDFDAKYMQMVADVKSDEYYINMMIAWYFATALFKQYDAALPYLTEKRLGKWVHNKTIQKAIESNRISVDIKQYLKNLKIK